MKRTGFIGGSDCVKIMQGDWQTLWEIKTGRKQPDDLSDNIAVQLGSWTESFNLSWFEKQHNCVLSGHQYEYEQIVGTVPCRGTVDARLNSDIVEAKHTNAFNKMDDVVELYMPQIQLYAHLAKADGTHLSVIFGNSKWESTFVHYNEEYFNSMWAVVSDFGVTCYVMNNLLVFKSTKYQPTPLRWTTWLSVTPAATINSWMQPLHTSTSMNTTASSRTLRKPSSKWSAQKKGKCTVISLQFAKTSEAHLE